MKYLMRTGLLMLVFSVSFLSITAICDYICWHTTYYQDAEKDVFVQEE